MLHAAADILPAFLGFVQVRHQVPVLRGEAHATIALPAQGGPRVTGLGNFPQSKFFEGKKLKENFVVLLFR